MPTFYALLTILFVFQKLYFVCIFCVSSQKYVSFDSKWGTIKEHKDRNNLDRIP